MTTHIPPGGGQGTHHTAPSIPAASGRLRQVIGKYELGAALAAGDFDCRTRLCSHVMTGAPYVVRIYDKAVLAEAQWMWDRVRASIHVQRTLPKHENIVEMVECFETASSLYILMQLFQSVNVTKILCSDLIEDGSEAGDGAVPPSAVSSHWSETVNRANQIRLGEVPSTRLPRPGFLPSLSNSGFNNNNADDPASPATSQHYSTASTAAVRGSGGETLNLPRYFPRRRARLTTAQVCNYFTQVVRGVLHMHDHHVVHLGIAPDHILINDRGLVKIGNLVSCCFCTPGTMMDEMKGTRHTVAPEVLSSDPFDPYLADAWSLGVLLYFMLNRRYPHDGANTLEHIMYNHIRPSDPDIPEAAKDLINRLLQPDPSKRMRVSEILHHRFFCFAEGGGLDDGMTEKGSVAPDKEEEAAKIIQKAYRRHEQRKKSAQEQLSTPTKSQNSTDGTEHSLPNLENRTSSVSYLPVVPARGSFHELLIRHKKKDNSNESGAFLAAPNASLMRMGSYLTSPTAAPNRNSPSIVSSNASHGLGQEERQREKSASMHASSIKDTDMDYLPCPVCHRPPPAPRNIGTKPYPTASYIYGDGRYVIPAPEEALFYSI